MEPITKGMSGPAVEDVQTRLANLGYAIGDGERGAQLFGDETAQAVRDFRSAHGLMADDVVDVTCWGKLVDASYKLGDRTLYLRLPNFHGADVKMLQDALNALEPVQKAVLIRAM